MHNTTPSGMYKGLYVFNQDIYYTPFFKLIPLDAKTQKIDPRFDYNKSILGLHESGTKKEMMH